MHPGGAKEVHPASLLFGIPVDQLAFADAAREIVRWAKTAGDVPRFVATTNVDFLVKSVSWNPDSPRHPELVEVLRNASLNTADGMPVVWASRLLGGDVRERVSGSDLVPFLASAAAKDGITLFLLGGKEEIARKAAALMTAQNPGLRIVGVDSPFVRTEGMQIGFEDETDAQICERINAAGADVLLVGFGNPKQEMWFHRNRHRLQVNVVLGVGGTLNFVAGEIGRAPAWMQKAGVEWIYRLIEEPGRLWQRYALGLLKFSYVLLPILVVHFLLRLCAGSRRTKAELSEPFYSGIQGIRVLTLPRLFTKTEVPLVLAQLHQAEDGGLVLDARHCRFIDASGLGALWQAWRLANMQKQALYFLAPSWPVRRLLLIHRAWDLVAPNVCPDTEQLVFRIGERFANSGCFVCVADRSQGVVVRFLGALSNEETSRLDREPLIEALSGRNLVIDFTFCPRVEGLGMGLVARLHAETEAAGLQTILFGANTSVQRAFHVTRLQQCLSRESSLEDVLSQLGGGPLVS